MNKIKDKYPCNLNLTHDLIGGKWKLQILWHIREGYNRFSLLEKVIPTISQKVLSDQLKELEASGLIEKEIVENNPPKTILYHLNKRDYPLEEIVDLLYCFSNTYAAKHNIELK